MKNILHISSFLVCSLLVICNVQAQTPDLHWLKYYQTSSLSGESYSSSCGHQATSDNGYIWAGLVAISQNNILVVKFNSSGVKTWERQLIGSNNEEFISIRQTPDGGYILAGRSASYDGDFSTSFGNGVASISFIMKLSAAGIVMWKNFLDYNIIAMDVTPDGGCVVSRSYEGICGCSALLGCIFGYPCTKYLLDRYDALGVNMYGVESLGAKSANDLLVTSSGSVMVGGHNYDLATLTLQWSYFRENFSSMAICESSDGSFYLAGGRAESISFGGFVLTNYVNAALILIDANGVELYYLELPALNEHTYPRFAGASATADGKCAVSTDDSNFSNYLFEFDNLGNQQFSVQIPDAMKPSSLDYNSGFYSVFGISAYSGNYYYGDAIALSKFGPTSINTENPSDLTACIGQSMEVHWSATSELSGTFQVQLSDNLGTFSNPVVIGSGSVSPISAIIPTTPTGTNYKVRVVRDSPPLLGLPNSSAISISPFQLTGVVESMGNVVSNTAVNVHESNNGFDNDNYTMSGNATITNSNISSGYGGASGNANVLIGSSGGTFFQIAGINTTGPNPYFLSFGLYRSNNQGGAFSMMIEVSTDGTNYVPIDYSTTTNTGWQLVNVSASIPSTNNLRLRFTRISGQAALQLNIDDIRLTTNNNSPIEITVVGNLNFCEEQGSVQLIGPGTGNWLWNTGATGQSIIVESTGTYYCQSTAADGCIAQTPSVEVINALTIYYADADDDGFGVTENFLQLCDTTGVYTATIGGDCDDTHFSINIIQQEQCNGIDDNCNGLIDEGFDNDADGYRLCDGDCNDNNPYVYPGAVELVNGFDDNCDGLVDVAPINSWYLDSDGDGYGTPFNVSNAASIPSGYVSNFIDCDDEDATRNPFAQDTCGDNIDNNCDGVVDNCAPSTCVGDLDDSGNVNITDLLIFLGVYGSSCNGL